MTREGEPGNAVSLLALAAALAGGAAGYFLARYTGHWMPLGLITLTAVFLAKPPFRPEGFPNSIILVTGYWLWLLLVVSYSGLWTLGLPDLVALAVGITWIWIRPGVFPALLLLVALVVGVILNVRTISTLESGTLEYRTAALHLALRGCAIVALVIEFVLLVRKQTPVDSKAS